MEADCSAIQDASDDKKEDEEGGEEEPEEEPEEEEEPEIEDPKEKFEEGEFIPFLGLFVKCMPAGCCCRILEGNAAIGITPNITLSLQVWWFEASGGIAH